MERIILVSESGIEIHINKDNIERFEKYLETANENGSTITIDGMEFQPKEWAKVSIPSTAMDATYLTGEPLCLGDKVKMRLGRGTSYEGVVSFSQLSYGVQLQNRFVPFDEFGRSPIYTKL